MISTPYLADRDFSFLDNSELRKEYASGPSENEIDFYVAGITCAQCVRRIEDLPKVVTGLLQIRVELASRVAHATIDKERLAFSQLADAISQLGFEPIPIRPKDDVRIVQKKEDQKDLIRLGVAGALAGNIMIFSFATYFGAPLEWRPLFSGLSMALYLPVVSYVAWPFYVGAFKSLKAQRLSIDLPMTVASLTGFIYSFYEWSVGRENFYFDSLSGFLFLILASRWLQKRLQRKFLRPSELAESLQLEKVRAVNAEGWQWRPISICKPGQHLRLEAQEIVPAECRLISSRSYFSLAWLSGEHKPKTFLRGSTVPAGAKLISGTCTLEWQKPLHETAFGQILKQVQQFSIHQLPIVGRADRLAQWLLASVFVIAITFIAFYWSTSPTESFRRALALLVVACPCAMAFGVPLAVAQCVRRSRKQGVVVKDVAVLERLAKLRSVFFDKTGTLTDSDLTLETPTDSIPTVLQKIVLSLENESFHPIAFAFRQGLPLPSQLPPAEALKEHPGLGVEGFIYGRHYQLKKDANHPEFTCCLFEDEKFIFGFKFRASLKTDAKIVLKELRDRGLAVFLLSGDDPRSTAVVAQELEFNDGEVYAGLTPEEKANVISQHPNSMMVGDGINDSLALMNADVSVAVSGGVESALKSSHVYISSPDLSGIRALFSLSQTTLSAINSNLIIAIGYNALAGSAALLGWVNPLVATLLMPLSSSLILFNSWWQGKK